MIQKTKNTFVLTVPSMRGDLSDQLLLGARRGLPVFPNLPWLQEDLLPVESHEQAPQDCAPGKKKASFLLVRDFVFRVCICVLQGYFLFVITSWINQTKPLCSWVSVFCSYDLWCILSNQLKLNGSYWRLLTFIRRCRVRSWRAPHATSPTTTPRASRSTSRQSTSSWRGCVRCAAPPSPHWPATWILCTQVNCCSNSFLGCVALYHYRMQLSI